MLLVTQPVRESVMGVNRYDDEEDSVSRGTLDGPPARSKGKTVPVDDLSTTVSLLGAEGYGSGEETDVSGEMGSDPAIRALTSAAKMLEGAQELNSILPLPQELLGMLDMIRVGIPKQLEQLEASRSMLGQSGAQPDPMAQFQLMGAQPPAPMMGGGAPAPSPMTGPAPAGPGAGQPGMPPGMPMI